MPKNYPAQQVDAQGNSLPLNDFNYTFRAAYDGNNNAIYVGRARIGSAEGSALWAIKKITYDGSNNATKDEYADGNDKFDNSWTNRAALSYS